MNKTTLAIVAALFVSIALGNDFKTIDGKEYKNVTVSRVEPDGLVLSSKSGIAKVYFPELPKEVQQRFNYDPEKAAQYRATEVEAAKQAFQQQQQSVSATATPNVQNQSGQRAVSSDGNVQSRNARREQRKQEAELRDAQNETEAIKAEARGDYFGAKVIRIRADYERRIREARNAGNRQLADELEKQFETKVIGELTREQLRRQRGIAGQVLGLRRRPHQCADVRDDRGMTGVE